MVGVSYVVVFGLRLSIVRWLCVWLSVVGLIGCDVIVYVRLCDLL